MGAGPHLTLSQLRKRTGAAGQRLVDFVWTFQKENVVGIPIRELFFHYDEDRFTRFATKLGGDAIRRGHEINAERVRLTLLGVLLSTDAKHATKLLERYLTYLRSRYLKDRNIDNIKSSDLVLADTTDAEKRELGILLSISQGLGASYGSGVNSDGSWYVSVSERVYELKNVLNWDKYIEDFVMKNYSPGTPVGDFERTSRGQNLSSVSWIQSPITPALSSSRTADTFEWPSQDYIDPELLQIAQDDWAEANRCFEVDAWKACVILCGSSIEALLLGLIEKKASDLEEQTKTRLDTIELGKLVDIAEEEGLLNKRLRHLLEFVRLYRNFVHPGRQRKEKALATKNEAEIALLAVKSVVHHAGKR